MNECLGAFGKIEYIFCKECGAYSYYYPRVEKRVVCPNCGKEFDITKVVIKKVRRITNEVS